MNRWVLGFLPVLCVLVSVGPALSDVSFDLESSVGGFGIGRESFDRPVDVVEDRDENIYVVDQGNNRIQVLDRRGRFVREWGGRGFAPGTFDNPVAITIDPGSVNLFVVDSSNHRVQKFDRAGKLLLTIGRLGSGEGQFNKPMDVAVDRRGNVFVADTGNDRIQKFDPNGRFVTEWGKFARRGRGAELSNPVSVAFSDEGFGYIYVLNSPGCQVQKFEPDGKLAATWPMHRKGEGALCGPSRIRVEPRQYTVYIADTENDRVLLFDRNGEPQGSLTEGKGPLSKPKGLFISEQFGEFLLVADTGNNLVHKYRRNR